MEIDTSKLLPSSNKSAGSLVKITSKSFAITKKNSNLMPSKNKNVEENKVKIILEKVITIENILKKSLDERNKTQENLRKEKEKLKRTKREEKLELKDDKKKSPKGLPSIPTPGGIFGEIIERIKRFVFFVVLGKLFTFSIDFLPKLKGILSIIGNVYQFTEKVIGGLLDGLIGFIDFGYKAYDKVRGIAKSIGGEKALKTLDSFTTNLERFLNLALIAGMIYASESGGFGGNKGKTPNKTGRGKPTITQSGGGRAGRPDIRNPLRDRPNITTSGGRQQGSLGRNPLRTKPTITTSGGKPVGGIKVPKGAGSLAKGARGIIGVGTILDLGFRLASGQPISKAVVGAAGGAAGAAIGAWAGGAIGGIVGSVVPVLGNILLGGAGAAIGGILGGMLGGWITDSLYDKITGYKENVSVQKHKTGGRVRRIPTSRPSSVRRKTTNKPKFPKKITPQKTDPGKSIGGKKKIVDLYSKEVDDTKVIRTPRAGWDIFGLFTGGTTKTPGKKLDTSAYNTLTSTSKTLKEIFPSALGEIMGASVDIALGQEPSEQVYNNLAEMISFISDMRTRQEYGNKIQTIISRFQEGGYVPDMQGKITPSDVFFGKNLKSSIKTEIKKKVDKAINNIKNSLGITGSDSNDRSGGGLGSPGGGGGDFEIVGGGQDMMTLATIAALESGSAQGQADVAQSVYNRLRDKTYKGKSITDLLTKDGQYQVAFKDPTAKSGAGTQVADVFKNIKTEDDAVKAIMYYYNKRGQKITEEQARQKIRGSVSAIQNTELQQRAAKHVGGRTDFLGYDNGLNAQVHRGSGSDNYFGAQYGNRSQNLKMGAAPIPTGLFAPAGGASIAAAAQSLKGMDTSGGPGGGSVSCVYAVNKVFAKAGVKPPWGGAQSTDAVINAARRAGWQQVGFGDAKPGDLWVYDANDGRSGHVGIMMPNGKVLSNSSSNKKFIWEADRSTLLDVYPKNGMTPPGGVFFRPPGGGSGGSIARPPAAQPTPATANSGGQRGGIPAAPAAPQETPAQRQPPSANLQPIGRQGSASTRDFGRTSGIGPKGYIIIPGHAAGDGAPGEQAMVKRIARNAYNNLKSKFPDAKIMYIDPDSMFADTKPGFIKQLAWMKKKEQEGWEILEIHMDASIESGYGTGRGVIAPTGELNPVEAYFAKKYGAFPRGHGNLAAPRNGVGLVELGNMSPELVKLGPSINRETLNKLSRPLEDAFEKGLNLTPQRPRADIRQRISQTSLNSYPPYADPNSNSNSIIAIQPIIINKTSSTNFSTASSSQHSFDSEISLNTNKISQYRA